MTECMKNDLLLRSFLATPAPAELGPGPRPGVQSLSELNAHLDGVLAKAGLSGALAELVRAEVLLWHDHLDASHALAQNIEGRDGSYVHGILHRREPDYGNAKYWFRRVGTHPCFQPLSKRSATLLEDAGQPTLAVRLLPGGQWDPFAFVDACETAAKHSRPGAEVKVLQQIQQAEFELLLDYLVGES
jgi:hypothetical protein